MQHPDPFARFSEWLEAAGKHPAIADPTAMCLATATLEGKPSARIVLLKEWSEKGFVFYTNNESRKGEELQRNPQAALCFYWEELGRQIRIEGRAVPVSEAEADAYFHSRPRESRIGAWASQQSRELTGNELRENLAEQEKRFSTGDVPRPAYWSGWRVIPERIEFWQEGEFRLHDRDLYMRDGTAWKVRKLFP